MEVFTRLASRAANIGEQPVRHRNRRVSTRLNTKQEARIFASELPGSLIECRKKYCLQLIARFVAYRRRSAGSACRAPRMPAAWRFATIAHGHGARSRDGVRRVATGIDAIAPVSRLRRAGAAKRGLGRRHAPARAARQRPGHASEADDGARRAARMASARTARRTAGPRASRPSAGPSRNRSPTRGGRTAIAPFPARSDRGRPSSACARPRRASDA